MADSQRIEDLRRRVQKDPASIAFAQLAEELRRAEQFEEAIDICRAGLAIHPGYLSARVTLGRALVELNQLDDALGELQYVLTSAPENLAAIRGVAEIHHKRGELADALKHYRAALALARNDPDLQQTVDDLARRIEPPKPAASAEGLSLEQITQELWLKAPPPVVKKAEPPPAEVAPVEVAPVEIERFEIEPARTEAPPPSGADPQRERADLSAEASAKADRTIAALEGWLGAIHAAGIDHRA